jgi:hypothetical protein
VERLGVARPVSSVALIPLLKRVVFVVPPVMFSGSVRVAPWSEIARCHEEPRSSEAQATARHAKRA